MIIRVLCKKPLPGFLLSAYYFNSLPIPYSVPYYFNVITEV